MSAIQQAAFRGATLGFGDELQGALRGAGHGIGAMMTGKPVHRAFGQGYREGMTEARRDVESLDPNVAAAAEIGGALATGGVGLMRQLVTRGTKSALAQGTKMGGLAGFGGGQGLEGRLKGAAIGAGVGSVFGSAGGGASRFGRMLAERAQFTTPQLLQKGGQQLMGTYAVAPATQTARKFGSAASKKYTGEEVGEEV